MQLPAPTSPSPLTGVILCLQPPTDANTVRDILADDITGDYESTWITFVYERVDGLLAYRALALDEQMTPGQAFWFTHLSDAPVNLDMPIGSRAPSTNLDALQRCVSLTGCQSIPLSGESTDSVRWNMVGNPFPQDVLVDNMRVSASQAECSAEEGCTLALSFFFNVTDDNFFSWNGSGHDLIGLGDSIGPWRSAWLAENPGLAGFDPVLHVAE